MSGAGGTLAKGERFPVLYLLHGLSDDHTIWMRRTSIERYAAARNLAVVMPAVARSFYQDMAAGPRYWSFLSEELPALMQSFFPIAAERERTFAAGLSMGGYGALRLGLAKPEQYAAVASFSGALDVVKRCREGSRPGSRIGRPELEAIYGRELQAEGTTADLWWLAGQVAASPEPRPALYLSCGTEDELLPESRAFRKHLEGLRLPVTYGESAGAHEWGYWDAEIQRALAWLPLEEQGAWKLSNPDK
jgi:S-formylglutathione hydrolase FrmB